MIDVTVLEVAPDPKSWLSTFCTPDWAFTTEKQRLRAKTAKILFISILYIKIHSLFRLKFAQIV
jgi:hypothetical protein